MRRAAALLASCAAVLGCAAPAFGQGAAYSIPADNPFVSTPGAEPSIFAYGLRNPWRFSFDRQTGDLTVADVGWSTNEEVSFVSFGSADGANFGWNCFEGDDAGPGACGTPPSYVPPALVYSNDESTAAVTGGYVARDPALGPFVGRYFYADFLEGDVRQTQLSHGSNSGSTNTGLHLPRLATFGEDGVGRLYAASTQANGEVRRLTQSAGVLGWTLVGTFNSPTFVTSPPGDASRVFVTERLGKIQIQTPSGQETFLDIGSQVTTAGERGLLSMAFAPDYDTSRRFFVFFTDSGGDVRVDEFLRSASNPNRADPASQRQIFFTEHSSASNHNGGQLQFGPDGKLYFSIGDGGKQGDPDGNAQSVGTRLGKIHRIAPLPRGSGSGAGGGGAAGGGQVVMDSTAPSLRVRIARRQRILRTKAVIAYVRTTEVGRVQATGRLVIGNASRSYRLRSVRRSAIPGRRYKLRLRLTRRQLRIAARAMRSGRRVRASVRLSAIDAAGNARSSRRSVRARR